jgi:hypothetical protein
MEIQQAAKQVGGEKEFCQAKERWREIVCL